jgi:hypothetical protein
VNLVCYTLMFHFYRIFRFHHNRYCNHFCFHKEPFENRVIRWEHQKRPKHINHFTMGSREVRRTIICSTLRRNHCKNNCLHEKVYFSKHYSFVSVQQMFFDANYLPICEKAKSHSGLEDQSGEI